ncbi:ABC-three component system protein [Sinomonas soli]
MNAHYSDADFNGNSETAVLSKEIPRIKSLVDQGELDNYVLFSNRRLGGVVAPRIMDKIAEGSGMDRNRIFLAGVEYLDELLREFPDLPSLARIDPLDGPLLVNSFDLAEIILAIAEELSAPLPPLDASIVDRISYRQKNTVNNMSETFARTLADRYLVYTPEIERFLASPANTTSLRYYEAAVEEFQLKIVAKRSDFQTFDSLFNYLVDILVRRDSVLARNRRLLRAMLFYMYWHCDIGETADADA